MIIKLVGSENLHSRLLILHQEASAINKQIKIVNLTKQYHTNALTSRAVAHTKTAVWLKVVQSEIKLGQ